MRSLFTSILLLLITTLRAGEEPPVRTVISGVTVYPSGAQISRTAELDLPRGTSTLIFSDLSAEADPSSIQVNGTGDVTILGVKHRLQYGSVTRDQEKSDELDARIAQLEREVQDAQLRIGLLQNEEQRLLKNEVIEAGDKGLTLEQLRSINDYQRERMTAVRTGVQSLSRKIEDLRATAQELHVQREQLNGKAPRTTSAVAVEVSVAAALKSRFTVRYIVRSAGWRPRYDLRVNTVDQPLLLGYRAQVYQSSGEDWKDVELELSSSEPRQWMEGPKMQVWRFGNGSTPPPALGRAHKQANVVREVHGQVLDGNTGEAIPLATIALNDAGGTTLLGAMSDFDGYFSLAVPEGGRTLVVSFVGYQPATVPVSASPVVVELIQHQVQLEAVEIVAYKSPLIDHASGASLTTVSSERIRRTPTSLATTVRGARAESSYAYMGGVAANYGDLASGAIQVNTVRPEPFLAFLLPKKVSIPSDGQVHELVVKEEEVPCTYRYHSTPRLDPRAYLVARATGWDALQLLPGTMNLYFEGTFLGESSIDPAQVADTLDIPLGADPSVVVMRTRERAMGRRQFVGSKRIDEVSYSLEVRNTKEQAIELVLSDQLPVPVNDAFTVTPDDTPDMEVDATTGFVTWRLEVAPRTQEKRRLAYTVRSPKGTTFRLD